MTDLRTVTLPRAVVEQALEALEFFRDTAICSADTEAASEAIAALRAALAQQAEPVLQSLRSNFNPAACYCACGTGGPCEHKWDGEGWESEDGCAWSATCSRCGCTAMSHDMRNAP